MATTTPPPVQLGFEAPYEVQRWRPIINWLIAIPHYIVLSALEAVAGALTFIAFFTVLFTKKIPRGIFDAIVMTYRYEWRVHTYVLWMREEYPPFDFTVSSDDPGGDAAVLSIEYPEELHRFMPLFKWLLAFPHYIALVVLMIAAVFAGVFAFVAVLATGRYPEGIRDFFVGLARWMMRVRAYAGFLRDEYPPFSLS